MMLLGELPDLAETASGRDLIRIGEERGEKRGEKRGREETILAVLTAWYGTVPAAVREKVAKLNPDEVERLIQFLRHCQSLDEVAQWLGIANP
jgi:hypothetical protein